jgi:hypothetical protein
MADENPASVSTTELREFVSDMRENAELREATDRQDMLAAIEQHWAGELEELIQRHE